MKRFILCICIVAFAYCERTTTGPLETDQDALEEAGETGDDALVVPDEQEPAGDEGVPTDPGKDEGPGKQLMVETSVSANEVEAGGSVTVTCSVSGGNSAEKEYETEIFLNKTEGISQQEHILTFTKTGEFLVGCRIKDTQIIDETPEKITVNPGAPVTLLLYAQPTKDFYKPFDKIKILHQVLDKYSNEVFDAALLPYEVEPDKGFIWLEKAPDTFVPQMDGFFKISTALVGYPEIEASLLLAVDSTPPVIDITTPHRGATLAGSKAVKVKGTVTDEISKVSSFSINGKNIPLGEGGAFEFTISSSQGLNLVKAEAKDNADNAAKVVQSFYFSYHYYPMDTGNYKDSLVNNGVLIYLNKDGFKKLSDIATAISSEFDIAGMVPSPAGTVSIWPCNYDIYITDITYDNPKIEIIPINGGVQFKVVVPNFKAKFKVDSGEWYCIKPTGNIVATSITITADIMLTVGNDGKVYSSVAKTEVDFEGLNITIDGFVGWLFDWLVDWLTNTFKEQIEQQFKETLAKELAGFLEEMLNQVAISEEIPIDPFIGEGEPVMLKINTEISKFDFTPEGGLIGLKGAFNADRKIDLEFDPLGSIGRASCLSDPPEVFAMPKAHELEVGAYDDFINEALFSIWWGGLLNMTLTDKDFGDTDLSQYGITDLTVTTFFLLPPIMTSCNADGQLVTQIGDLFVDTTMNLLEMPAQFTFYASLEAELNLAAVQGEKGPVITFKLGEISKFEMQFVKVSENFVGLEAELESLIKDMLISQLLESFGDLPGFTIPAIDLSAINPDIPPGTIITLSPDELTRIMGYTVMMGKLLTGQQ